MFDEAWTNALLVVLPREVLAAGYRLLIAGTTVIHESKPTTWWDIGFSLLEIVAGLFLAGLVAFCVSEILLRENAAKNILISLLPLSHLAPIGFWLVLFFWTGVGIWLKIALVACLAFFPVVQAFWSFRDKPLLYRVLIAADEALPVAFVAMVFGEAYASTAGLGFIMIVAGATLALPERLAASLLIFALLAVISATLRWNAKRLNFSNRTDRVTVAEVT